MTCTAARTKRPSPRPIREWMGKGAASLEAAAVGVIPAIDPLLRKRGMSRSALGSHGILP
jgi:hypothetical protein